MAETASSLSFGTLSLIRTRDSAASAPLTNLHHLNFLLGTVPLLNVPGHTTYQQASQPTALAPWVYANYNSADSYTHVGGGDPSAGPGGVTYYGQGAFDADDIARTAVLTAGWPDRLLRRASPAREAREAPEESDADRRP